jgi:hypothetical protein
MVASKLNDVKIEKTNHTISINTQTYMIAIIITVDLFQCTIYTHTKT